MNLIMTEFPTTNLFIKRYVGYNSSLTFNCIIFVDSVSLNVGR